MDCKVFLNGKFLPAKRASVSIQDTGFLFGHGLFETMRSYEGFVYKFEEHIQRLSLSADFFKIPLPFSSAALSGIVQKILKINNLYDYDAHIKIILSAGICTGKIAQVSSQPNFIIQALPFIPYPDSCYKQGIGATLASMQRSCSSPIYAHKTLNFLENILAKHQAAEKGYQEAIFLNSDGFVSEGSISNIFIIQGKRIITPSLSSGILPGITRSVVFALCNRRGISSRERKVTFKELAEADEAFLTNSLREVIPLTRVDSYPIGNEKVGNMTKILMKEYTQDVADAKVNFIKTL